MMAMPVREIPAMPVLDAALLLPWRVMNVRSICATLALGQCTCIAESCALSNNFFSQPFKLVA